MPKGLMSFFVMLAIVLAVLYIIFKTPVGNILGVVNTPRKVRKAPAEATEQSSQAKT